MNQSKSAKQEVLCFLENLQAFIQRNQLSGQYIESIDTLRDNLDSKLTLLVLGEVNAGKSSLVNALLGEDVCPVAALPCTDKICELAYGEKSKDLLISETQIRKILPARFLENIDMIDTPGTNSTVWRHNDITASYIPNADIILAVLPAKNPFGQSIWELLSSVNETERKKVLFILQQSDMVKDEDLKANAEYIENFALQKGFSMPMVLPVSVKLYQQGEKERSGVVRLQDELGQLISLMSDSGNLLVSKMAGVEALLQKISAELEVPGDMLATRNRLSAQLDEIRTRNHNDSLVILEQYSADFNSILDELERHAAELCHGKARYKDLKNPGRVREFFDLARQRCDGRAAKLAEEFVESLSDGYNRVKRRLADLLVDRNNENRIGKREIYEKMDVSSDQFIAIAKAEAKSVTVAREPLDAIAADCAVKTNRIMARSRMMFWLIVFAPIILYVSIAFVIPAFTPAPAEPESKTQTEVIDSATQTIGEVMELFSSAEDESDGGDGDGDGGLAPLFDMASGVIKVLGLVVAALFYVPIVAGIVRTWVRSKLEACAIEASNQVRLQRDLMHKKLYNSMLEMIDKIDKKYYVMYDQMLGGQNIIAEHGSRSIPATALDDFTQLKKEWKTIGANFAKVRG